MEGHALSCPIETSRAAVEAGLSSARDWEFAADTAATTEIVSPSSARSFRGPVCPERSPMGVSAARHFHRGGIV
jgi:hypothetical protein